MAGLGARVAGGALAAALALTGAGFAVAAVYLGWRELLPRPLAAAATAACLFLLAALVHLGTRGRGRKREPGPMAPLAAAAPLLGLVRDKPALTLLGALGLGALLEQLQRGRR